MDNQTTDFNKASTTENCHNQTAEMSTELDLTHFDDDSESISSRSTTVSSSCVDSEDNSNNEPGIQNLNSGNTAIQQFANNSSISTVGNVRIQNSSDIHIGKTYHIYVNKNESNLINMPQVSLENEEQISELEEAKRDDAFFSLQPSLAPGVLRIVERKMWLARDPMEPYDYIHQPVKLVVISHSATDSETTQADNIFLLKHIQNFHVESNGWNDISYNFMIGNDGYVYQGRGWRVVGAHAKGYNTISLGISFIGTFMRELPPAVSLNACKMLIKEGVECRYIDPDYKLVGHCQCSSTQSPGRKLFEEIQTWDRYCADLKPEELFS